MSTDKLKVGGVYRTEWDDRPYRVIGLDDVQVFYDCLWSEGNWTFSGSFKKKCYFYRTSSKLFAEKSKLIEFIPLTEPEQLVFRPDLPMRIGRTKESNWNGFNTQDFDEFSKTIAQKSDKSLLKQQLLTDKIVLIPYGNKGGLKKGIVIVADNSKHFECLELIYKAKELQESFNNQVSQGIGLYRLGFEKGLPSYSIGEFIDRAGLLKE